MRNTPNNPMDEFIFSLPRKVVVGRNGHEAATPDTLRHFNYVFVCVYKVQCIFIGLIGVF